MNKEQQRTVRKVRASTAILKAKLIEASAESRQRVYKNRLDVYMQKERLLILRKKQLEDRKNRLLALKGRYNFL